MRAAALLTAWVAASFGCASPSLGASGYAHPGLGLRATAEPETPLARESGWNARLTGDGDLVLRQRNGDARMALRSAALPETLHDAGVVALGTRWLAGLDAGELGLGSLGTSPLAPQKYVTTLLDVENGEVAGLPARLLFVDLAEPRRFAGRTLRGPTQLQVIAALVRGNLEVRRDVGEVIRHEPAVVLATLVAPADEIDARSEDFAALLRSLRVAEDSE